MLKPGATIRLCQRPGGLACGHDVPLRAHVDARSWMAGLAARVDRQELELLVRRYVHGERGTEIADDLSQSSGAVRIRLMRLRSTLLEIARGCSPWAA